MIRLCSVVGANSMCSAAKLMSRSAVPHTLSPGGGVIVKVGAYPPGRFYAAGERCAEIDVFALWHGDGFLDMVVLDALGDDQLVLARVKSHGKLSFFGMVRSLLPCARSPGPSLGAGVSSIPMN